MNLFFRILSALVVLPLAIAGFVYSSTTSYLMLLLVALVGFYEFGKMVAAEDKILRFVLMILGAFVLTASCRGFFLVPALVAVFALLTFYLFRGDINPRAFERVSALFLAIPYIGFSLALVFQLRHSGAQDEINVGLSLVFLTLAATWSNDTFAYFAGRAFGRHKLWEKISQKKTWEGFVGGSIGSIVGPFLIIEILGLFGVSPFEGLSSVDILCVSVPAILLAPLGDLIESGLKRTYGVKDAGQIMPGHGGILDRIDGILLMIPWTATYAFLFRPMWY